MSEPSARCPASGTWPNFHRPPRPEAGETERVNGCSYCDGEWPASACAGGNLPEHEPIWTKLAPPPPIAPAAEHHIALTLDRPAPHHVRLSGIDADGMPFIVGGQLAVTPVVVETEGEEPRVVMARQAQVEVPDGARVTRLVVDGHAVPPEILLAGSKP